MPVQHVETEKKRNAEPRLLSRKLLKRGDRFTLPKIEDAANPSRANVFGRRPPRIGPVTASPASSG